MAWGFWNKIKKGFQKMGKFFKKVWDGGKKVVKTVNDVVVKPFKPLITAGLNKIKPGAGNIVDAVSSGIDVVTGDGGIGGISNWAKQRFK